MHTRMAEFTVRAGPDRRTERAGCPMAAIALGLDGYDSARIRHSPVSAERVHEITIELLEMTRAERAAIPVMHPGLVAGLPTPRWVISFQRTRTIENAPEPFK